MADNTTLPASSGDADYTAGQNVPNLADILRQGPNAEFLYGSESLPQDNGVPAPDDSVDNDDDVPAPTDGDGNAKDNDNVDNAEGDDTGEDSEDTQQTGDLPTEGDIDWEYKVPVKIDGKEEYFTLEELRKGYATAQHLSAKGRELGEARKQLETEREEKLQELVKISSMVHTQFSLDEQTLADQYHSVKAQMEKAIEEGDGYEAKGLKQKLTEVQTAYWEKKNQKTELETAVGKHLSESQERQQAAQAQYFQENIGKYMPDFNQEKAVAIREFALKEGIPDTLLNQLYEPAAIKMLYDYMTLKNKSTTGAQKREAAPKTVPTKKGTPQKTRQENAEKNTRNKVLSGNGDKADELAFLRGISKINSKL